MVLNSPGKGNPIRSHRPPPSETEPPPDPRRLHQPPPLPPSQGNLLSASTPGLLPGLPRRRGGRLAARAGEIEPGAGPRRREVEKRWWWGGGGAGIPDLGFPRFPLGSARTSKAPLPAADLAALAAERDPSARLGIRGVRSIACPFS